MVGSLLDKSLLRQIAATLVVSERTVGTHLDHMFAKLGISSRTALAAFAVRNGLI